MAACGSGIGRVAITSSKRKQSCSRVHKTVHISAMFILLIIYHYVVKVYSNGLVCVSGSLDSEAGIYALSYDITGSRLVTCEADKTIKMWKEDENATPETHPLNYKPPKELRRF